jgi:hypothetical protein
MAIALRRLGERAISRAFDEALTGPFNVGNIDLLHPLPR